MEATNSKEETEITKEFEDYKKESKKFIDFCRRMMGKRGKREKYGGLEQPQGIPDVKPISKEELDEKIKEAWITPKEAQNIGENTIPPQYSREVSRYEPPIARSFFLLAFRWSGVCWFFYFLCNCARGIYFSGYALMSCDFGECCESVP